MAVFNTIRANAKRVLDGQTQYADAMNTAIDEVATDAIDQVLDALGELKLTNHEMLMALAYITGATAASFYDDNEPSIAVMTMKVVLQWIQKGMVETIAKKNA